MSSLECDVLIVGAGPAGLSAGIEAAAAGVDVIVLDDKRLAGGQLVKQTHMFFGSKSERAGVRGIDIAAELASDFARRGGRLLTETTAVGLYPGRNDGRDGRVVGALRRAPGSANEFITISFRKAVVATGAYENMLPFPNCDLPGVYGAGGFQTLMNVDGVLPGRRVLMVGAGNIGLIVSYQLMQAGGSVAAIVEAEPRVGGYAVHAAKVERMGVPLLLSHTVTAVGGADRVEYATVARLGPSGVEPGSEFTIDVDAVCLSVGLTPLAEMLAHAGVRMEYVPALGGMAPRHDSDMRTSDPDIYVAGDAGGIGEASAAMVEGRIAGASAAAALTGRVDTAAADALRERLVALRRGPFGEKVRAGKLDLCGIDYGRPRPGESTAPPASSAPPHETGKRVVIECTQRIPCNPCEEACGFGAIEIGEDMTRPPVLDGDLCTGCGACLTRCPGLAIFMVDMGAGDGDAEITIPYEMLPLPTEGDEWHALDRTGAVVARARITKVREAKAFDRKALVSFSVPREFAHEARHVAAAPPAPLECREAVAPNDDPIVCRCSDVRRSEIEAAIDEGYHSVDELKRLLRVGMGPCQGKTCSRLVVGMLSRRLGKPAADFAPMTARSPYKPVALDVMAAYTGDEDGNGATNKTH